MAWDSNKNNILHDRIRAIAGAMQQLRFTVSEVLEIVEAEDVLNSPDFVDGALLTRADMQTFIVSVMKDSADFMNGNQVAQLNRAPILVKVLSVSSR